MQERTQRVATKKTEKAESTEPTESELLVQALQGLQQQLDGATPTEREDGRDATYRAIRDLYARLGATLSE